MSTSHACGLEDRPVRRVGSGFQEVGLPFESDPAITRHLAHFLGSYPRYIPAHEMIAGCYLQLGFTDRASYHNGRVRQLKTAPGKGAIPQSLR